jgi:hypothetical protein
MAGPSVAQVPGEVRHKNQERLAPNKKRESMKAPYCTAAANCGTLVVRGRFFTSVAESARFEAADWSAELSCLPVK